jgi:peptidoglycan-N-acetylglucosamine deacetylase
LTVRPNTIDPDAIPALAEIGFRFARRGGAPEHPYDEGNGFAYKPGHDHPLLLPSAGDARPFWTTDNLKRATRQASNDKIVSLQFNGVPDVEHPWRQTPADPWVHTSPERFGEYMQYLHEERFTVIALRDLAKYVDWLIIEQRKRSLTGR